MTKFLISVILYSIIQIVFSDKQCYVIAFQDGGDTQSYQAGAFQGILEQFDPSKTNYDVVTGVGFGGLNAAILASYAKGDERDAANKITDLWKNMRASEVFETGVGGNVLGDLFQKGMFQQTPLKNLTQGLNVGNHQRDILLGATNTDTAEYERWDQNVTGSDFLDVLQVTTAIPTLLQYQNYKGSSYFSGSTVRSLDVSSGIERCIQKGYSQNEVTVDAIISTTNAFGEWEIKQKMFDTFLRKNTLLQRKQALSDYNDAVNSYPHANYRCLVVPHIELNEPNFPFTEKEKGITETMLKGQHDARKQCSNDFGKKQILEHYNRISEQYNNAETEENQRLYKEKVERIQQKYQEIKSRKLQQENNNIIDLDLQQIEL